MLQGLEDPKSAHPGRFARELGHLKADLDVTLRTEVVDLVGPDALESVDQRRGVGQVPVVQVERSFQRVDVAVQVVDAARRK